MAHSFVRERRTPGTPVPPVPDWSFTRSYFAQQENA
jgi:hypothetical protein